MDAADDLAALGVADAVHGIRAGLLSSVALVEACLERIHATDGQLAAWAHLDGEAALEQARSMDRLRQRGLPLGELHGVPVGIKDIFDVAGMPTTHGIARGEDRVPGSDSAVVERLREAGAVILGKTVTTELAFMHPASTTNPHDPERTPGGSSSGSAAAVGARQVPMAIGSQTNGSTVRPAAFCGIYGFKPTRGIVSRAGCLRTSHTLDHVGVFARSARDVALLTDTLSGYDARDEASYLRPRPRMAAGYDSEVPVEPAFAWLDLPFNERLSAAARAGFEELLDALGDRVERLPAPPSVSALVGHHTVVHEFELRQHVEPFLAKRRVTPSAALTAALERARGHTRARYEESLAMVSAAERFFESFFYDYDAIVTPAAAGEAPALEIGTGDPVFCSIWTFCGLPSLSLPLLEGDAGLPVGVQLVGSANGDDRLFRTARWLLEHLDAERPAAE